MNTNVVFFFFLINSLPLNKTNRKNKQIEPTELTINVKCCSHISNNDKLTKKLRVFYSMNTKHYIFSLLKIEFSFTICNYCKLK